jgi:hypothetical protein
MVHTQKEAHLNAKNVQLEPKLQAIRINVLNAQKVIIL